jgi:quercetin dioxygenase-like cupin family protein
MRSTNFVLIAAAIVIAACSKASANDDVRSATSPTAPVADAQAPAAHASASEGDIHWGPAPAVFPPGAEFAVMQGDPSKAEPFTVRLRFPNGYKIPPHTHPTAENVTVLSGTFLAGMGAQFDESTLKAMGRDDFASIPAGHAHYAKARGLTVVQVHAIGPFALTYVNPADTPAAAR